MRLHASAEWRGREGERRIIIRLNGRRGGGMQRVVGGHAGKRRDRGRWVEGNSEPAGYLRLEWCAWRPRLSLYTQEMGWAPDTI
jgi:hypothetical protein